MDYGSSQIELSNKHLPTKSKQLCEDPCLRFKTNPYTYHLKDFKTKEELSEK